MHLKSKKALDSSLQLLLALSLKNICIYIYLNDEN